MIADLPLVVEAPAQAPGAYRFRDEAILGTRMNLVLVARDEAAALAAAHAARAEIDRLDTVLNTRRADSEIFRLNGAGEHRASADLFAVVAAAEGWRTASGGAYSGRLGRVIDLWGQGLPDRAETARLAREAADAVVVLDAPNRTIRRPPAVRFALDGLAKGWIVDRALEAAMAADGVTGALVDIGGDLRCAGVAPDRAGWSIGLPDPVLPFDNAPLIGVVAADGRAMATSGRGPRDRMIAARRFSPTLSPLDGWPVRRTLSATVVAASAADADALATALLVLPRREGLALADAHGAGAWITGPRGGSDLNRAARPLFLMQGAPGGWASGWQALATFTAPRRQLIRDPDFRSPYMAMWITDTANRPVRTLILAGKRPEWQRDNHIWWSLNRANTAKLVATRAMSTSGAGVYNVFWDGVNDAGAKVPPGRYVLHVETSRERGKHTYRSLALDFTNAAKFKAALPPTEEGGGLTVSYDHY